MLLAEVAVEIPYEEDALNLMQGNRQSPAFAVEHPDAVWPQIGSRVNKSFHEAMIQPTYHHLFVSRFVVVFHERRHLREICCFEMQLGHGKPLVLV